MSEIVRPGDPAAARCGGKAGALAALHAAGLPIPPWFALAPEAFYAALSDRERGLFEDGSMSGRISEAIAQCAPTPDTARALAQALAELCPTGEPVAVRSSARDEDDVRHSFAGQLESFLCVPPAEVPGRVADVWRSAFSDRVVTYRRARGLNRPPDAPAVLIQRMVNADCSGVAFGADPVSGRRGTIVVAAVYGLGTLLVSGEQDADTYRVDRTGRILSREVAHKRVAHRPGPGPQGVCTVEIPEADADRPVLGDDQIRDVAELAHRTGVYFERPQDIEWAIERGRMYLLQSRPITSLANIADPDGVLAIWDNSNIAESYAGVTTPLTFSFARGAYEAVYRQFCRIMHVPAGAIAANEEMLHRMLGLIRGRIYYNLLSWYRILALLPGYTLNRRFMEQMMGVREGLPEGALPAPAPTTWRDRAVDWIRLVQTAGGLLANYIMLPALTSQFFRRLDDALRPRTVDLDAMRPDELVAYYHDLERRLLARWDAPIINDFFAMIFYGALRRLAARWCDDHEGTLPNDLLCGEGGMISAEPAARMRAMAQATSGDAAFVHLLQTGALREILEAMERCLEFKAQYRDYLVTFGDRCLEELKLESPTLHDDPLMLLRAVGQLADDPEAGARAPGRNDLRREDPPVRRQAQQRVAEGLGRHPIRRAMFFWVLAQARARVRERENLRFERTRVFGLARRIFLELGRRFFALDLLERPRDVFYLELNEILGIVQGTATCADLKGLVAVRKAEFGGYEAGPAPPDRFETRGMVQQGLAFLRPAASAAPASDTRRGLGCCPGVVRGQVRLITNPRTVQLRAGEVIVAERTDPGWVMLFPLASGLLVERGSLLSHSAIVARELGLPTVVALAGVTAWLKDGDWVELDGGSGVVRRLASPTETCGNGE